MREKSGERRGETEKIEEIGESKRKTGESEEREKRLKRYRQEREERGERAKREKIPTRESTREPASAVHGVHLAVVSGEEEACGQ